VNWAAKSDRQARFKADRARRAGIKWRTREAKPGRCGPPQQAYKAATPIILQVDPAKEPARAGLVLKSYLARARWITAHGYRHILKG
jgi:hypothetical protein